MLKNTIKKLPKKLPKFLYKYFWNIKIDEFDPAKSQISTINTLLDKGNLQAIKWVFEHFPTSLIVETIKTTRDWQKLSINFWATYFNLPRSEVKCLNKQYLEQRKSFWPY